MVNNSYDDLFDQAGQQYDVDPRLLKTVFHIESSGNPRTRDSAAGAQGGMQIMPANAQAWGIDPHDMTQAVPAAAKYIAAGLQATNSPEGALAYYHGGPDRSIWGPKTAAYVEKGRALYPQMALKGPADDAAFASKWGLQSDKADAPASSDAEFDAKWGLKPEAAPSAPAPTKPAEPDYTGWDVAVAPKRADDGGRFGYEALSRALAPAPNTTYGAVLPFATDNTTGATRLALPTTWRDLAQGGLDLLHGPATGTVTPAATMALGSVVGRLTPSPAAGTGAAIAAEASNPLSAEFRANPGVTTPQFKPMAAQEAPSANPMVAETVAPPVVEAPTSRNPMAAAQPGTMAESAARNPLARVDTSQTPAGMTAQEASEYAAIPEKLPPAPIIPPTTQGAAAARADQLITHFAARKGAAEEQDLIPGFVPTLAQKTGDPGIATLERGVQSASPGSALDLRYEAQRQAIKKYTQDLVQTPEDAAAFDARRDAMTAPMRDAAFQNKSDVSPKGLVNWIDETLAGPDGKRTAVVKTLTDVKKQLYNDQGQLEADPEILYGVRKHINDLLSPAAQRDNPELQRAASHLSTAKDMLDDAIEQGAPGFRDYIKKYAELSKPGDALRYLQSLNLTDQAGDVRGAAVDAAIKSIGKQRAAPGVQKSSGLSDDQMDALQRLHRTIQVARQIQAGKPLNSTTFQNLATNSTVGSLTGNPLVSLGMAGAGHVLSGGTVGALAGAGANMLAHRALGRSEDMVKAAMMERLLNLQGKGDAALRAP